jgi:hypothetical protein
MFVPFGRNRPDLDKARAGEGDRAFAASGGACSLTKGLVIVPYILQGLRSRVKDARPTFKWCQKLSDSDLLLFEAFVTHVGKSVSHEDCARLAIREFFKGLKSGALFETAIAEPCTMNLLDAMLMRVGWIADPAVLAEPCLAVQHIGGA